MEEKIKMEQIIDTIKNDTSGGNEIWNSINTLLMQERQMFIYEYIIEKIKLANEAGYKQGLRDMQNTEL